MRRVPAFALPAERHTSCPRLAALQVKLLRGELEAAQAATAGAAVLTAEWRHKAEQFDRDRQAAAANIRWGAAPWGPGSPCRSVGASPRLPWAGSLGQPARQPVASPLGGAPRVRVPLPTTSRAACWAPQEGGA